MGTTLNQILNGRSVVPIDDSLPGLPNGQTRAADAYAPYTPRQTQQAQPEQAEDKKTPARTPPVDSSLQGVPPIVRQKTPDYPTHKFPETTKDASDNGGNGTTTTTSPSDNGGSEARANGQHGQLKYQQIFERYFPDKPLTEDDIKKEQKKRRREAVFSAIGDGISALANLYYTNRYAPSMYNPEQSLSKRNYEKWQKLVEDRKAMAQQYYNAQMKAMQAEDLQAIRQQNADANEAYKRSEAERKAKAQEISNAKVQAMTDLYNEKAKGIGKMNEAELAYLETKIDCLNRGMNLREAEAKAKIAKLNAETNKANRTGTSGGNGVSSSGGSHEAWDENGKEYHFKSEAEANDFAKRHGTYEVDYGTSTTNKLGIKSTTTSPHGGHRVQPPAKPKARQAPKPKAAAKKTQQQKKGAYSNFSIH